MRSRTGAGCCRPPARKAGGAIRRSYGVVQIALALMVAGRLTGAEPVSIAAAKLRAARGPVHCVLRGAVTAPPGTLEDPGDFYIQDDGSGVLVHADSWKLAEGERVELRGWMYLTDSVEFRMRASQVSPVSIGDPLPPRLITLEEALDGGYEGSLVAVRGAVLRVSSGKPYDSIWIESGRASLRVFLPPSRRGLSPFENLYPGTDVAVSGISVPQTVDPAFDGDQIRIRSPSDVVIRRTPQRAGMRLVEWSSTLAGAALLGAAGWIWMLRRKTQVQ
jgi:hypothetical protein